MLLLLLITILGVSLSALGYGIITNLARRRFMAHDATIKAAFEQLLNLAKTQRLNVGNLLDAIERYTLYEQELFEEIKNVSTHLQDAKNPGQYQADYQIFTHTLQQLVTVVNYYPPLLDDADYLATMEKVDQTQVLVTRQIEVYNGEVTAYNARLAQLSNRSMTKNGVFNPHYLIGVS